MFIFKLLLAIIITEAITELATKSEIFYPIRKKIFNIGKNNKFFDWLHSLLDCGYCFSVWSGMVVAFLFFSDINLHWSMKCLFIGIILHRLSNLFHNLMDRIKYKDKV
jgi:hypothetical protein